MADELYIATMEPRHLDGVIAIEQESFTSPWSRGTFLREITENPYALYLVAMAGQQVAGYAGTWLIMDEAHITNIAVAKAWRRRGVARRLLDRMLVLAHEQGIRRVTLEVRRSNQVAQNLYRALGFYAAGVRPGYYTDNSEDAVIMWLDNLEDYFTGRGGEGGSYFGN